MLEVWQGPEHRQFTADRVSIGRSEDADVTIDDERVSRRHLEVRRIGGRWIAKDLDSANGTFVDGARVTEVEIAETVDLMLADADRGIPVRLVAPPEDDAATLVPTRRRSRVVRIGRARDNDVVLHDNRVSRYHAELVPGPGQSVEIRDCGSANGTTVNGRPTERAPVEVGALVEVGDSTLRVVATPRGVELEVVAEGATDHADRSDTAAHDLSEPDPGDTKVTPRERELLALVAGGATDREIAQELFISIATVRSHLDRIHEKTGHRRRAELTRLALELGLAPRTAGPDAPVAPDRPPTDP